jgi:hypothetical protein
MPAEDWIQAELTDRFSLLWTDRVASLSMEGPHQRNQSVSLA